MEHKTILGGAQYLSFARSRLAAFRATGIEYITRRYVLADATVEVRINGEHDYIRIEGGACEFPMDTGVVDVYATGPAAPARYTSGTLHETDEVAAYTAPFVPTDPPGDWKVNPGAGSAGQFAGKVIKAGNHYTGRLPYDAQPANSFKASGDEDAALYAKKVMTTTCPASVFTGRCRLYVQAIYGLPARDTQSKVISVATLVPTETDAPPRLEILGRKTGQEPVRISTSTGVYLDASGRHWLVNVNSASLAVYLLKSTACGEALRKSLASDALSADDKDHIEAYVLSQARPDTDTLQVVALSRAVPGFALGYGWHWNWSGTAADIVDVNLVASEGPFAGRMSSSHQRISLSMADGVFTAGVATLETAEWVVLRAWWPIACPNYSTGKLSKVTPRSSALVACDAPLYAFYRGDSVVVTRVQVKNNTQSAIRQASPYFANTGTVGSPMSPFLTAGMNDGFAEDFNGGDGYYSCAFTCAGVNTGELPQDQYSTSARVDVNNKVDEGVWGFGFTRDGVWDDVYLPFGEQAYPGAPNPGLAGPFDDVLVKDDEIKRITYDLTTKAITDATIGTAVVVVPFYDAEAIFISGTKQRTRETTGSTGRWATANAILTEFGPPFVRRSGVYPYPAGPDYTWFERTTWSPAGGAYDARVEVAEHALTPTTEVVTESNVAVLVCQAGTIPATFPGGPDFHDNLQEEVDQRYPTWSGAARADTVVLAPVNAVQVGIDPIAIDLPVLVGWA